MKWKDDEKKVLLSSLNQDNEDEIISILKHRKSGNNSKFVNQVIYLFIYLYIWINSLIIIIKYRMDWVNYIYLVAWKCIK